MRPLVATAAATLVLAGCTSATERPTSAPSASAPGSAPPTSGTRSSASETSAPEEWRTEVWRDVQLEVPARWELGYAPMPGGVGARLCGTDPPDGPRGGSVGRPGYGSDMCMRVQLEELGMDRPGVWFGSPLPVGEAAAKTGLRQVTVDVGSSRVTVASKNDALLNRILGSVEQVRRDSNGCPATPRPARWSPIEGYGDTLTFAVCVYERSRPSQPWDRQWTAALPARRAEHLLAAVDDGEPERPCSPEGAGQLVLLHLTADDPMGRRPLPRDLVAQPSRCSTVHQWALGAPSWVELSPEIVRPWAVPGVSTYVYSNGLSLPAARYYRSMWG